MTIARTQGVACLYFPTQLPLEALHALAESCLSLSSQIALRGSEAVFVETGGSRLLHSEASLQARLLALARRFQAAPTPARKFSGPSDTKPSLPLRLGWGNNAGEAWARARYSQTAEPLERWPLEVLECYASPFLADEEIARQIRSMVAALRSLGAADLGAFLALPSSGWGERFGPNAAILRERLDGRMAMGWPRFEPETKLAESQDLRDVETQSVGINDEALRFHLKRLCDRIASRLRGRGLRAASLRLRLNFERSRGLVDLAPWNLELALSRPVAEPSQLRKLMRERLEGEAARRGLPRALESLGLEVTATAPGFSPQRDAFDHHEEEVEAHDGLVARLTQRLGKNRVFYAELLPRHKPEQAWRPGALSKSTTPKPKPKPREYPGLAKAVPRPTRLVRRPLLLTRTDEWLIYWGGAGTAKRWHTLNWEGPERIADEWWTKGDAPSDVDVPEGRDYWRVSTEKNADLWVFSRMGAEARTGALWLQGWWA